MSDLTFNEFRKKYLEDINATKRFDFFDDKNPRLSEQLKIQRSKLEKIGDLEKLGDSKIVWYRDQSGNRTNWFDERAKNIILKDEASISLDDPRDLGITKLINDLKDNGLAKEINIIVAFDERLKERVIVDGVHRSVSLFYLLLNHRSRVKELLESDIGIYLIEIKSPAIGLYFPADFFNIYRR